MGLEDAGQPSESMAATMVTIQIKDNTYGVIRETAVMSLNITVETIMMRLLDKYYKDK